MELKQLSLRQKALLPLSLVLICEMAFGTVMFWLIAQSEHQLSKERHAREVITELNKLSLDEQSLTFELMKELVLPDSLGSVQFESYVTKVRDDVSELKQMVDSEPQHAKKVHELELIVSDSIELIEKCRKKFVEEHEPMLSTLRYEHELNSLARQASDCSHDILDAYRAAQETSEKEQASLRWQVMISLMIGLGSNFVLAVGLAAVFGRNIGQRLEALSANSVKLAAGMPLEKAIAGDDEIARVDKAFHEMAAALAEMAQKERAVVENALDFICSIDKSDRFTVVNPACQSLLGYSKEELIGRRYADIVAQSMRAQTRSGLASAIEKKGDVTLESCVLRKDGSEAAVIWTAHWSPTEQSLFCVIHDISERKAIERMKEEFLHMVSHDLRTPITSVHGLLTLVVEGIMDPTSETGRKRMAEAQVAAEQVIDLVTELLDLDRMESGRLVMDLVEVKLSEVVRRCVETLEIFAHQRNVKLVNSTKDVTVLADKGRLAQVLTNLVANAIKFSPSAGTVEISSQIKGDFCEVKVIDQGPGIPAQHKDAVFQRYKQLPTEHAKSGSGLGLAICKEIVECHNGSIGVESEEEEGASSGSRFLWQTQPIFPNPSPKVTPMQKLDE